ncbi:TlpA family protein disulfide reductase [Sphingobacterium sp. WQ 366]|uniref:TlpA family protein disulfide reductase n=2 Tax=Sphingobacterium bovistauri TaxID=2781959 RepID=A0ABS7Z9B4_9SPHI|nr:TlpA family protein disulfide reductase [Sphingobacterium bovistauri]
MKSFRIAQAKRFQQVYEAFPTAYRKSDMGKFLPLFLDADAKTVKIGQVAPNFKLTSSDGKQINLSDYQGKYVYLDFWASWCKGCRMQHPLLRRLHQTYKDAPLEIISVSLDAGANAKEKWLKAVENDKLTWVQVAELTHPSAIQKEYGFLGVPMNFLINPEGKIEAHYLHDEYLETYLNTLFSTK